MACPGVHDGKLRSERWRWGVCATADIQSKIVDTGRACTLDCWCTVIGVAILGIACASPGNLVVLMCGGVMGGKVQI